MITNVAFNPRVTRVWEPPRWGFVVRTATQSQAVGLG
jgi:hypothetical protein